MDTAQKVPFDRAISRSAQVGMDLFCRHAEYLAVGRQIDGVDLVEDQGI